MTTRGPAKFIDQRDDIKARYEALRRRLKEEFPNIVDEQAHLDEGSREQAYWHYGYAVALRDVLKLLARTSTPRGPGRSYPMRRKG